MCKKQEAACGILYLHGLNIVHRNVSPENILIGGKTVNAKVAGYGSSHVMDTHMKMTFTRTLVYLAPEICRAEPYSFPVDVYSFALTVYAVCDQDVPFSKEERKQNCMNLTSYISKDGNRPKIRSRWNPAVSFLISSCWSHDPLLRPTMRQIVASLSTIMKSQKGLISCAETKISASK